MNRATFLTHVTIALALLSTSVAAESIEAARAAFSEGDYVEAADLGEALGTSEGHALAAEALAIYAHYIAEDEDKDPLLQRAMLSAETAISLNPASAEAHLQSAHAVGRYSQLFSPMKSMREGYPKEVRVLIERALELNPDHAGAHLSLAAWHAEAIGRGGMMARAMLGADRKSAYAHFEQALALWPRTNTVLVRYASAILLLERRKGRERARELLERAIELPPEDAFQRLIREQAVNRLEALEAESR